VNNLDLESLSTDKALYNFAHEIKSALNNKMHFVGISCDLAEAFDCVYHDYYCQNYIFIEFKI
jgi:hypothetical protein